MTSHQWSRKGNPPPLNIKWHLLELSCVSENRSRGESELQILDQRNLVSFWSCFYCIKLEKHLDVNCLKLDCRTCWYSSNNIIRPPFFAFISALLINKENTSKKFIEIQIIVSHFTTAFFADHYDLFCRFIQIIFCAWVQINPSFTFKLCRFCQKGFWRAIIEV